MGANVMRRSFASQEKKVPYVMNNQDVENAGTFMLLVSSRNDRSPVVQRKIGREKLRVLESGYRRTLP